MMYQIGSRSIIAELEIPICSYADCHSQMANESAVSKPFSCEHQLTIHGGWLKDKPWVIDFKTIQGSDYYTLHQVDRGLARALGFDCSLASPMHDVTMFSYMRKIRNDHIDQYITNKKRENDPGADIMPDFKGETIQAGRSKAFAEYEVPEVLPMTFPSFVTQSGIRQPEATMNILTAPMRTAAPTIEVNPANLEWLLNAAWTTFDVKSMWKRKLDNFENWPKLPDPLKYRKIAHAGDDLKVAIVAYYRLEDGKWKKKTMSIGKVDHDMDEDLRNKLIQRTSDAVQLFYQQNHAWSEETYEDGQGEKADALDED